MVRTGVVRRSVCLINRHRLGDRVRRDDISSDRERGSVGRVVLARLVGGHQSVATRARARVRGGSGVIRRRGRSGRP